MSGKNSGGLIQQFLLSFQYKMTTNDDKIEWYRLEDLDPEDIDDEDGDMIIEQRLEVYNEVIMITATKSLI